MKRKSEEITVPTYEELLKPVRISMVLVGIPFEQNPKLTIRFIVMWIAVLVMIIQETVFIANATSEQFFELTGVVPCTAVGILAITKVSFVYANRNSVMDVVKQLEFSYVQHQNDHKWIYLVRGDIKFVKSLTVGYVILNQMLVWTYNLSSLILMLHVYVVKKDVVYVLPYAVAVPYEVNSWSSWSVAYFCSVVIAFVAVMFFCTVDCLYYILTSLICTNFTILNAKIKELNSGDSENLIDLIKNHQYLLKLSSQLESIFTGPNLLNVVIGSLQICILGFNLTFGGWDQLPASVLFICSVLLQILMMSMFGERLIEQSRATAASVYLCEWINMDIKSKKLLMIMQLRALRPQALTAYKFSLISYQSFTRIISTSWSYFTILRTVFKPTVTENPITY